MHKKPKLPAWLIYAVIVVVASTALILFAVDGSFERKDLAAGLFALFGTFAGALLAFRLEESRDRAKEVRTQKAAINRALVVLGYQHNEVRTYRDLMLPYKHDIELAFNFPASQPPEHADMRQRFDDLDFLLASSTPQILFELIIEQERFDQAMAMIRHRNEFYVNQVQPVFAHFIGNGNLVSSAELKATLGEYLYGGAMQGATSMRSHIEDSNMSLPELQEKLRNVAKEIYKDEKFVRFDPVPLANEKAEQATKVQAN